jgi:hypothetical protein
VVDVQAAFSLDGHTREPLSVGFTERAAGSLELPARAAAAAREQPLAPGLAVEPADPDSWPCLLALRELGSDCRYVAFESHTVVNPFLEETGD